MAKSEFELGMLFQVMGGDKFRQWESEYALEWSSKDGEEAEVGFFTHMHRANEFKRVVEGEGRNATIYNLFHHAGAPKFSFDEYREPGLSHREIYRQNLYMGPKRHLHGELLNYDDAKALVESNRNFTTICWDVGDVEYMFFTNNHLFGYGMFPSSMVSCSTQLPLSVVPRETIPTGEVTTLELYLALQGENKHVVWSIYELMDLLNIED